MARTVSTSAPLPPRLRLEIQYAIQCRVDCQPDSRRTPIDQTAAGPSRSVGAVSLLDHPLEDWLGALPAAASTTSPRAFLRYAIDCLLDLRDGGGWDGEY